MRGAEASKERVNEESMEEAEGGQGGTFAAASER
jgi:hypothetical protein